MITFPLSAVGETLYDARGNPIAVFKDYRDAAAVAETCTLMAVELQQLHRELKDLREHTRIFSN